MSETPARTGAPPRPRERPWLFALMLGALVFGVGFGVQVVAWEARVFRESLLHVSLVASLVVLAMRRVLDGASRRLLGARGPVVAWRVMAVATLALGLCHLYSLDYFIHRSWSFFGWFGRLWELEPEFALVPAVAFLAAAALARATVPARGRLRAEALVTTALALALVALAFVRTSRAPELHHYVDSLPQVGVIPALGRTLRWQTGRDAEPSTAREVFTFGEVHVARYVFEHRGQCGVLLARDARELPESVHFSRAQYLSCDEQGVRVDRPHGVYVISHRRSWSNTNYAFDARTLRPFPTYGSTTGRLRDSFSLPRAWSWSSALMLMVALAALLWPRDARRALAGWRSWRPGTLGKDGMIAFDDGPAVPCPYGTTLTPGPVVLLHGVTSTEAGPFRAANVAATPDRDDVRQGTIAEVVASFEAEIDARHAYVTAASLLAAAPWVAALSQRLIP